MFEGLGFAEVLGFAMASIAQIWVENRARAIHHGSARALRFGNLSSLA
jgi:hypothetical protein